MVESNRNGRHRERSKQIKPSITGGETDKFNLAFPHVSIPSFPLATALSPSLSFFLLLACNQHSVPRPPSNKYISFDLINVDFASHKEREGEPKSLRNRRHQENIRPKSPCTIMLSFMFLFLVLLESFILFLAHPPNFQIHLHLTLLMSRAADTCVYI